MIAIQTSHRPSPASPYPIPPPHGAPEQRRDEDAPAATPPPQVEQLLARLEEGYEFHTRQLEQLTAAPAGSAHAFDAESLAAASRQALTMIAAALRDMAEGRYGICAVCSRSIPLERLEARPEARHCVRCQAASTG